MRSFSPAPSASSSSSVSSSSPVRGQWRRLISLFLAVTLLAVPIAAADDDEEDEASSSSSAQQVGEVVFDVLVLRPLGTVQTLVGLGFFAVAGPLSAPGGSWNEAWDVFVGTPYEETFNKKLGRF